MLPTCFKGRLPVTEFRHIFSDSCTGLKIVVMAMLKVAMGNHVIWMCGSPWKSCDGCDLIER